MIYKGQPFATPEEAVAHFGVKGMKWGVRKKFEPIGRQVGKIETKREARRERRVKENEVAAQKAQAEIDRIKANPSRWSPIQMHRKGRIRELERIRDQRKEDAKDIREGKFTDREKKIMVGVGVVGGILAVYGTYKFIDSGTASQILRKNPFLKKNDLLSRNMSKNELMKDVVKQINPGYGDLGTKMNCRRCTFAYEMRRRGYDVKATNTVSGSGQNILGMLNATDPTADFKTGRISLIGNMLKERIHMERGKDVGPVLKAAERGRGLGRVEIPLPKTRFGASQQKAEEVFEALKVQPSRARGELGLRWIGGGAHSMAWEIVDGVPHVFDTQTGISYTQEEFAKEIAPRLSQAATTRLDTLALNSNYLRRWVTNVK